MNRNIEIIDKIEALLDELKSSFGATSAKNEKKPSEHKSGSSFPGLRGKIYNLVQDGFFKDPKTISEIQSKLRAEAINKPTSSLMRPLHVLIKKKALARSKAEKGPFRYHQR